jgi:deoxyribonuclease V
MWPRSAAELVDVQRALADAQPPLWRPVVAPAFLAVGAVAICFPHGIGGRGARGDRAWTAAAVLRGRTTVAQATVVGEAGAPYEPGLLALREGPLLEAAVRALRDVPDVLLVDATGRDHPRRAGLALHLGAVLDLPTVGVTHRPLLAEGRWPDEPKGQSAGLVLDGEPVGAWARRRAGVRPVAAHAAWRTDVDTAVSVVLGTAGSHRTPEPLRRARRLARLARAER